MPANRNDSPRHGIGWHLRGWLLIALNAGLGAALIAQGLVLYQVLRFGGIAIPDALIERIDARLAENGLAFDATGIEFDLGGRLLLRELELHADGHPHPVLTAERAFVDISITSLLFQQIVLQESRVQGATLYCPALYSPTGAREATLEKLAFRLKHEGTAIQVERLAAQLHAVRLVARGLYYPEPIEERPVLAEPVDQLLSAAGQLVGLRQVLEQFREPILQIELGESPQGESYAAVNARARSLETPAGLALGPLVATSRVIWKGERLSVRPVDVRTDSLQWRESIRAGPSHLRAYDTGEAALPEIPSRFTFATERPRAWGLGVDFASGSIDARELPVIAAQAFLARGRETAQIDGSVSVDKRAGTLALDGHIDPRIVFDSIFVERPEALAALEFENIPRWFGTLELDEGFKVRRSQFDFDTGPFTVSGVPFRSVAGSGEVTAGFIHLPHLHLVREKGQATGSLTYDMAGGTYRFQAKGHFVPTDFSPLITAEWWGKVFDKFSFPGPAPYADIDAIGSIPNPVQHDIFIGGHGRDLTYNGVPLAYTRFKTWFPPRYMEIFDLSIEHRDGTVAGDLFWHWREGQQAHWRTDFDLVSTMPLPVAAQLAGDRVRNVVKDFYAQKPPRVEAVGTYYGKETPRAGESYLDLTVNTPHPISWKAIPVDSLSFTGRHNPRHLTLRDMALGIAGGQAEALADIDYLPGDNRLSFTANLSAARFLQTVDILRNIDLLGEGPPPGTPPKEPNPLHLEDPGLLDMAFEAAGILGQIETFSGSGDLRLYELRLDPQLFSGFTFTSAAASMRLNDAMLYVPELTMQGPSARLTGSGEMVLPQTQLNFKAVVYPLGSIQTPVFSQALSIIGPLAKTFEVNVRGTADQPELDVDVDPLGAFKPRGRVEMPEPEDPLEDLSRLPVR